MIGDGTSLQCVIPTRCLENVTMSETRRLYGEKDEDTQTVDVRPATRWRYLCT